MAAKLILSITLLAFVAYASAANSMCTAFTCAGTGSCSLTALCPVGQYCNSNSQCTASIAIDQPCTFPAINDANPCAAGRCVTVAPATSPTCQRYLELLPGQACTKNSECMPIGTSSVCGSDGKCAGLATGAACTASFQCGPQSYCTPDTYVCAARLGTDVACTATSQCSALLSCIGGTCKAHFSQAKGAMCTKTIDCVDGLFCSPSTMTCTSPANAAATRTLTQCDIRSNTSCAAGYSCSCDALGPSAQYAATCSPMPTTYTNMAALEKDAYDSCITPCGGDVSINAKCISTTSGCTEKFCKYFTRVANDIFPASTSSSLNSCFASRVTNDADYGALITSCKQYAPITLATTTGATTTATSAGNSLAASLSWALLVAAAVFFFEL